MSGTHTSLGLLHPFPVTLLFPPSTFHPFTFLSGTLPPSNWRNIFNTVRTHSCLFWPASVHQLRHQTAPRITRTLPVPYQRLAIWVHSPNTVVSFQMRIVHVFKWWLKSLSSCRGLPHFPGIFKRNYAFHTSCSNSCLQPHTIACDAIFLPLFCPVCMLQRRVKLCWP